MIFSQDTCGGCITSRCHLIMASRHIAEVVSLKKGTHIMRYHRKGVVRFKNELTLIRNLPPLPGIGLVGTMDRIRILHIDSGQNLRERFCEWVFDPTLMEKARCLEAMSLEVLFFWSVEFSMKSRLEKKSRLVASLKFRNEVRPDSQTTCIETNRLRSISHLIEEDVSW